MTDREDREEVKPAELWPGRYMVTADYPDGYMVLFQPEMTDEEARELLEPYGFTPEDENYLYIKSQAEETFTEEQADKLIAFMESFKDTKAEKKPAYEPKEGYAGVGSMAVGGGDGFYMLDKADEYDLDFKVWAYYDTSSKEPLKSTPEDELRQGIRETMASMRLESLQELRKWLDEHGQ
ncbi:MAG: hypothetical protein GX465_19425 [Acidobacteria bacterium]|nr:hypothetical protein [Acidobacteriota bacterium]